MQNIRGGIDNVLNLSNLCFRYSFVREHHSIDRHTAAAGLNAFSFGIQHVTSVRIALVLCRHGLILHLLIDFTVGWENGTDKLLLVNRQEELTDKLPGCLLIRTAAADGKGIADLGKHAAYTALRRVSDKGARCTAKSDRIALQVLKAGEITLLHQLQPHAQTCILVKVFCAHISVGPVKGRRKTSYELQELNKVL